jgi:hypothetical protein
VQHLDSVTIQGAWKYLCSAVMLQAVQSVRGARLRGPEAYAPEKRLRDSSAEIADAWDWIGGGTGVISFEDCCESLGVDAERARRILIGGPKAEYN